MIHKVWRLSENSGDDNLGLACTEQGLVLGRTALIERRDAGFVVRERSDLEHLLRCAYQTKLNVDRLMSGLATVAAALNANDQGLARIAAVHLRIPDLPDNTARDAMEAADILIKSADWNPALHPRAGTPPNPAGSRQRTAPAANHFQHERRKTTIRRTARMPRQMRVTIGLGYGPDQSASTNSPTSSSGWPTPSPKTSRR